MSEREQSPSPAGSAPTEQLAHGEPAADRPSGDGPLTEEVPTTRQPAAAPASTPPDDWREQTTPGIPPVQGVPAGGPAGWPGHPPQPGYGFPPAPGSAAAGRGDGRPPATAVPPASAGATAPQYSTRPVTVRRPDPLASLLLLLAGFAAAVSLLLRWLPGEDRNGWELTRDGLAELEIGVGEVLGSGAWQALAVGLGGAALFVLGLLLVLPARTHRFLGVLALLVSLVAATGVLVPLAGVGWDTRAVDVGYWFAVAVPGLGLLGALKAMFTGPRRR